MQIWDRSFTQFSILTLLLFSSACGKKKESGSQGRTYPSTNVVDLAEVSSGGCLNLEYFHDRLQTFPGDTQLLIVSKDIQVSSEESLGEEFETLLYHAAFIYKETDYREIDFIKKFSDIRQNGCSSVDVTFPEGDTMNFAVAESGPDHIRLTQDSWGSSLHYRWLGPQSLDVRHTYVAQDRCPQFQKATVTQLRQMNWGGTEILLAGEEIFPRALFQKIIRPLENIPDDLRHGVMDVESAEVPVSREQLRSLNTANLKTDYLKCSTHRRRASDDDEDPEGTLDPHATNP